MKNLILLVVLGLAGYFVYESVKAPASELESGQAASSLQEAPEPVDGIIRMRVRRAIEVWKQQSNGRQVPSMVDLREEVAAIRRRLYGNDLHDEAALKQTMVRAAVELGHAPDQAQILVGKVLAAAAPARPKTVGEERSASVVSKMLEGLGGGD
jgi:hypothetical protein